MSFWSAVGLVALLFGDAALRGSAGVVARWLPVALLGLWVLWLVLWRSSIRLETERVVVTNVLRVHEVPWAAVAAVVQGPQIRLELEDGSRLVCYGGPFAPRPGARRLTPVSEAVLEMDAARESAPPGAEPTRTHWDVPALVAGGILLLVAAASVSFVPQ